MNTGHQIRLKKDEHIMCRTAQTPDYRKKVKKDVPIGQLHQKSDKKRGKKKGNKLNVN